MDLLRQTALLLDQNREISADFVRIELQLAITFCQLALTNGEDPTKVLRDLEYARVAYEAAARFASHIYANKQAFQNREDVSEVTTLLAEIEKKLQY